MNVNKIVAALLSSSAVVGMAANYVLPVSAPQVGVAALPTSKPFSIPACPTEDSDGPCYWDAAGRGNGKGRSFVVDGRNRVTYLSRPTFTLTVRDCGDTITVKEACATADDGSWYYWSGTKETEIRKPAKSFRVAGVAFHTVRVEIF